MKLTNAARKDIVDSVIKSTNIPAQRDDLIDRLRKLVRATLVNALPEGFLAATKDLPREWFAHDDMVYMSARYNPQSALLGESGSHKETISFESLRHTGRYLPNIPCWDVIVADLYVEATKLRAREDAMRSELAGFLASCSTTEKAVERMPALERHMPAPTVKAYPVLASTAPLLKALKSAGFDTGAAK